LFDDALPARNTLRPCGPPRSEYLVNASGDGIEQVLRLAINARSSQLNVSEISEQFPIRREGFQGSELLNTSPSTHRHTACLSTLAMQYDSVDAVMIRG